MLKLDHKVPSNLILPERIDDLRAHLESQKAHWFSAQTAQVSHPKAGEDSVKAIDSLTTDVCLRPAKPNKANSKLEGDGLVFQEATHCGFMLPELNLDPANWSCAVRFRAPLNSARTLITVNPEASENYVFLHQVNGQVTLKDQKSTREVTSRTEQSDDTQVIVVGSSENRLWLKISSGETLSSEPANIALHGPKTLFVGCRSNRPRLLKTLGSFQLLDLVFWPDRNILAESDLLLHEALTTEPLWRPAT